MTYDDDDLVKLLNVLEIPVLSGVSIRNEQPIELPGVPCGIDAALRLLLHAQEDA